MESQRPSVTPPAHGSDPAHGLIVRPRDPLTGARRERGRLSALVVTAVLHVAAAGCLLLGNPVSAGNGARPVSADAGRIQLRFVSAPSVPATASGESASSAPVARASASRPATAATTATAAPLDRPMARSSSAALVLADATPLETEDETSWPSIDMSRPMPSDALPSGAPVSGAGHLASGHGQGHHHGHGRGRGESVGNAPAQSRASDEAGGSEADWTRLVMRRLEKFRTYPAAARHHRAEGVVMVQATIGADGKVLETRLRTSCGNADLDAEALATFARARTLPAPPAHLPSPLRVDLPVAFTLRG